MGVILETCELLNWFLIHLVGACVTPLEPKVEVNFICLNYLGRCPSTICYICITSAKAKQLNPNEGGGNNSRIYVELSQSKLKIIYFLYRSKTNLFISESQIWSYGDKRQYKTLLVSLFSVIVYFFCKTSKNGFSWFWHYIKYILLLLDLGIIILQYLFNKQVLEN